MYITSAITLSKKNIGEFDREYCFFTKKFGKIIVIAKGIRKANAKLQGQIEPPCLADIDFNFGNQKRLTGALVKNNYPKIRESLRSLSAIRNILSLINEFILFTETDIELWNILKESLDFLEKSKNKDTDCLLVDFYFTARLIRNLGFKPNLKENTDDKLITNKQTIRSLKILFELDLNTINKKGLIEPILNQKENISKLLKHYLKYIKNIFS